MLSNLYRHVGRVAGRRSYNFASTPYVSTFGNLPTPSFTELRTATLDYLKNDFNPESWHTDPVRSVVNGSDLKSGNSVDTLDAFLRPNGKIIHANTSEVNKIIEHINSYTPPLHDIRPNLRRIEDKLFKEYSGLLIGNQAKDFLKQDGVTEIEESIQANLVERRMNDLLFSDEQNGKINIDRSPAFIGCVSNFSNFLDLFRKVIRNMELGVPCVVLSRSNTTQHSYRWTRLLLDLMEEEGVDSGMLTYASADLPEVKRIFSESPSTCPSYFTCSRELAKAVKSGHANSMCSTGGPNTLVAPRLTEGVKEAIRFSAMIENSGQCTALRHTVVAGATAEDVESIFNEAPVVTTPEDSLKEGEFAGLFADAPVSQTPEGYTKVKSLDAHYKIDKELPEDGVEEYWRQVFVDVTSQDAPLDAGSEKATELAAWLVRNQPITLAVNENLALAKFLFEKTGQVVYTVGGDGSYALTCQARPQEGEIFGEFPVRRDLAKYTKYPVVVPSSTPSYNTLMNQSYLTEKGANDSVEGEGVNILLENVQGCVKGYCIELTEYLRDSVGAKEGYGDRTTLWGLQRPPIDGKVTVVRAGDDISSVAAKLVPFVATNARNQVEVSVNSEEVAAKLSGINGLKITVEDDNTWAKRNASDYYNVLDSTDGLGAKEFPLPGHFVSLYMGVGHVKSTKGGDQEFLNMFRDSEKWLDVVAA
ncbi:hypothetical protein TrLO_g11702 [Triparma laevis f. longispina]|uniref:Uncharacterized protein n=1 Tax=Triparma laevis f. longispina TaxID=1714387 RepID=A0A9W7C063_9STRA|nr:hypothetical protein TrLO_g11702 [Triparma laevis f. longispina]